jgi:hypothetical protein
MLSNACLRELRLAWLPNMTDGGLTRLIDLLQRHSPLLIHGSFTRAVPMGCLATHVAWNHPRTAHFTLEAGVCWLSQVAGLNPATSEVIREWDSQRGRSSRAWELRNEILAVFKEEELRRQRKANLRIKPVVTHHALAT